jgi:uncharacterized membrane protein YdjX (TVP38/TMEM64 family)
MKNYKKILGIILIVAVLIGLSRLPLTEYLNNMITWFRGFGIWAPIMYFIFFTFTSATVFPVFMLSMCAGILFGVTQGVLVVSLGNLASCLIMFLIARYKGREWFDKKLKKFKAVGNISRAIESEGWKMLFMLRVVPIAHMILLNITCGMSKLRTKDYILGTWLGMLPLLVLYVYMGSLTDTVISSPRGVQLSGNQNFIFGAIGITMLIFFIGYMRKVTNKYLKPAMAVN